MEIKKRLEQDIKEAMSGNDKLKLSTLRIIKSEIHNKEISKKKDLTGEEIVGVFNTEKKKHQDSIDAYKKGGRDDLMAKEQKELEIIESYLPEQMSEEEVNKVVQEVVSNISDEDKQFGKVMGQVMAKVKGKADGQLVNKIVKDSLSI